MNKKTIIFKVFEFPHLSETFILAQIITAIKLGYDVKIIVVKLLDLDASLYRKTLIENNILDSIIIEDYKIPKNTFFKIFKFVFLLLKHLKKIKAILSFYNKQNKFSLTWLYQWNFYEVFNSNNNVFHVQYGTNRNPLDLLKAAGFYKPSLIVTFHGHDAFFPINGFIPNNGYYDNLFTYGDLITANTPYLAKKIVALGCPREKMKIIPVGVDTTFFNSIGKNKRAEGSLKIITVGRLDPVKGHKYSIEVVNEMVQSGYDIILTIIGEGSERKNLEKLIENYNLKKNVFLLGKKSQDEIRSFLIANDLYVITAVPLCDGRRETQGLATLEAQACGLPVIAFDSGGVKYTIELGKTGFVFDEYDTIGIVTILKKIYLERSMLKEMSANTKKFIDANFSQTYINDIWDNVYQNLFNQLTK
ncbi:glycosyltransferase [Flavobacterium sp.]|uniref:glycosyltransferase n=2 Tax=Flavobacterium sp. TaxID=239 RepID=UPI0040478420